MIKVKEKEETSLFQFNATKLPTADSDNIATIKNFHDN